MLGWLSQSSIPNRLTVAISLPNSEAWRADFLGAFLLLTEERNWEEYGALSSEEMADEWRAIFLDFVNGGASMIPVGSVLWFAGSVLPNGFLWANGAEISREDYSDLFGVIGETFGNGDNETTFNLPDLRRRSAVGFDDSLSPFDELGNNGGEIVHTLSLSEMPSHNHGIRSYSSQSPGYFMAQSGGFVDEYAPTEYVGGGEGHNNMQPFLVLNHIVKF